VRRAVKVAAAGVLHYSGLRKAMAVYRRSQSGGRRLLIVSYHRVVEDLTGELQRSIPGLLISQETFRRHLEEAASAGYEFATMGEAVEVMAGRKVAKRDLCVVTFDDGYRDVYRYAYPLLKRMGVPAIVYLPTDFIGTKRRFNHDRLYHLMNVAKQRRLRPYFTTLPEPALKLVGPILSGNRPLSEALDGFIGEYSADVLQEVIQALEQELGGGEDLLPEQGDIMDWDEVRRMAREGIEFGAHTLGHTVLTMESPERMEREIVESKRAIEREVAIPVRDFAYCNGWYSEEVIRLLEAHGFRSGVTTEDLPNRVGADPFTLKRKVLWENFSIGMLGDYSTALTGCQLDDCFGMLGMSRPVEGRRPHLSAAQAANSLLMGSQLPVEDTT